MTPIVPLHGEGFLSGWDEIAIVALGTIGVFVLPVILKRILRAVRGTGQ